MPRGEGIECFVFRVMLLQILNSNDDGLFLLPYQPSRRELVLNLTPPDHEDEDPREALLET